MTHPADTHARPLQDQVRRDLMKHLLDISAVTLAPRKP